VIKGFAIDHFALLTPSTHWPLTITKQAVGAPR
jgi:hypothetical protein